MITIIDHPLVADKLLALRNEQTLPADFRRLVTEISALMAYPVLADIPTTAARAITPMQVAASGQKLAPAIVIAPILRAGLAMENGFNRVIPEARVSYIGISRNEANTGVTCYYQQVAPLSATDVVIVLDPMLATGTSAAAAINLLTKAGAKTIKFVALIASPQGIKFLAEKFPDLAIYVASRDEGLDAHNYIIPGLGDAGDRLYGKNITKPKT